MNKDYIKQVIQKAFLEAYKATGDKDYLKIHKFWRPNIKKIAITGKNTSK